MVIGLTPVFVFLKWWILPKASFVFSVFVELYLDFIDFEVFPRGLIFNRGNMQNLSYGLISWGIYGPVYLFIFIIPEWIRK